MIRYTLTEKINDTKKKIVGCIVGAVFTVSVIMIGVAVPLMFKGGDLGENISSTMIEGMTSEENGEVSTLSEKRANDMIDEYIKLYGVK